MTIASLWIFLVPLVAVLVPVWLGHRYGSLKSKQGEIKDGPVGSAIGATMGMAAFMLAFTFQIVGSRYDKRKELLAEELSEMRTAYLYSGLVPEPFRSATRRSIVEYVDLRVELFNDFSKLEPIRARSLKILDSIWGYSEALAKQDRSSEAYSLYITSSAKLISLLNERFAVGFQAGLPRAIRWVLAMVIFFAMVGLGYQFGIAGNFNFQVKFLLALTFAAVMWLVFALDHPGAGFVRLDRRPLWTLQEQLHQYQDAFIKSSRQIDTTLLK